MTIGTCSRCHAAQTVPVFSSPPARPRCACDPCEGSPAAPAFDCEVDKAVDIFREECDAADIRDTLLRMHGHVTLAASSYAEGDGKSFLASLISVAAMAKLLSATVELDLGELDDADSDEEAGHDSEGR